MHEGISHHVDMNSLPRARHSIGLTMGDPSGIGPEICLTVLAEPRSPNAPELVLYGDATHLTALAQRLKIPHDPSQWVHTGGEGAYPVGVDHATSGEAAHQAILRAHSDAMAGHIQAMVTAPISKKALHLAGHPWPGHTELLAHLANPAQPPAVRMMLANDQLTVVLDSIHTPLRTAIDALSVEHLQETIQIAAQAATQTLGLAAPRIAVAGLNPHASEDGAFGDEEARLIAPAIQAAQALAPHCQISGPWPADTVFMRACKKSPLGQAFDLVVCLYHDQGLIPIKLNGLDDGVNITIGLPYIRTSVDHGTAFDIAGRGWASAKSLGSAVRLATQWLS
jgi:4-hydroxythreonine-4-phosphate dehydrogenase